LRLPWCSHWFQRVLGAEVDNAREGSWSRCFEELAILGHQAFPSGFDVDGLAYPVHQPIVCSCQMREQGHLLGVVLSYRCSVRWHLTRGAKPLGLDICGGANCLGTSVIAFTRSVLLLPGYVFICWNHYDMYACIPGLATITDYDGMDPST
jgi:hypothetical protein